MVPVRRDRNLLGWRWRMWQLGYTHESNGSTDPLSRSWDRVFLGTGVERGDWSLELRLAKRIYASGGDNPDISDWVGRSRLTAVWTPGLSTTTLVWRNTLKHWDRGSLQLDWSYPFDRAQRPDCVTWSSCSTATARRCSTTTTGRPAPAWVWRCSSSDRSLPSAARHGAALRVFASPTPQPAPRVHPDHAAATRQRPRR